jgi:Uncharacterized conserved protein (some members contain a von Willebrand factor type A (vWA) domain)
MATQIDTTTAVPGAHLIDPTVLAKIGNLDLLARTVVDGFINGLHRAPHLGSSTDFAEHRQYMPGDDIRRIDWRLYGRTDKYFVKQYEADTNTNFSVVLDVSKSMRYGGGASEDTGRVSKLEYGAYLAACLTYFSSLQRDRVGLVTVDTDVVDYIPSSAKHLRVVLQALDRALKEGREASATDATKGLGVAPTLAPPLRKLSEIYRRRSMLVVISDFYEEPEAVVDAVNNLRGRGNDIMVFHLLDPTELEFPFIDSTNFVDLETGEKMPVIPEYLRKQYREVVREHIASLGRLLRDQRIDYALFDTSKPLDGALFAYLATRERLRRVR